jgi:hypothetical protein
VETVKESVQILMDLPVSVTEEIKVEEEKIVKNEEFEEKMSDCEESETKVADAIEVVQEVPRSRIEKAIFSHLPEGVNEIKPSEVIFFLIYNIFSSKP